MSDFYTKTLAVFAFVLTVLSGVLLTTIHPAKQITPAFYYWKTQGYFSPYNADSFYAKYIHEYGIKKVYIKMLDVDYVKQIGIVPISRIELPAYSSIDALFANNTYIPDSMIKGEVVPVVFITNSVMKHLAEIDIPDLATKILQQLLRLQTHTVLPIREIQFDCDWSASTREKYFKFLSHTQQLAKGYTLSATIRLHQFKHRKQTGIPPVQRGMLMLYNLNNATKISVSNSIFNTADAQAYIRNSKAYPLPLDLALPIFSWGLLFEGNQFIQVMNDIDLNDARKLSFAKEIGGNKFYITTDTLYHHVYLQHGQTLKIEQIRETELLKILQVAHEIPLQQNITIALFDLNPYDLQRIRHESVEMLFSW